MKKITFITFLLILVCSVHGGNSGIRHDANLNEDKIIKFKTDLKEFKYQVDELRKLIKNEKT